GRTGPRSAPPRGTPRGFSRSGGARPRPRRAPALAGQPRWSRDARLRVEVHLTEACELPLDALLLRERRVEATSGAQLRVRALLHHAPLVEHDDVVAERRGRHAMRDEHHRALRALPLD